MTDGPKIVKFPEITAIEAEAAAWVARFDGGDVSAEDYARFQTWLNQSTRHREAVSEFGKLWSEFDKVKQVTAAIEAGREAAREDRNAAISAMPRRRLAYVLGGGIAAVLAAGFVFSTLKTPAPVELTFETAVGAHRNARLPDGSSVALNTNSRIDVTISGERRDVRLVRGEAYFDVAHGDRRPFTVFAGSGQVRDIGTAFDVRLREGTVKVSVAKGSVEIATLVPSAGTSGVTAQRLATLNAGQEVWFDRKIIRWDSVSDADMNRRLAWREGALVYSGEPLATVVEDISRYSNIQVNIDPGLRERRVGGSFKIDQIRDVFTALESNFGVRAQWISDTQVRITPAAGENPRQK